MKIRCNIDRLTLHGMALAPAERAQLERVLHEQLGLSLRDAWTGADGTVRPAFAHDLRLDLRLDSAVHGAGAPLGHALGQALGAALSPAAGAGPGQTASTKGSR